MHWRVSKALQITERLSPHFWTYISQVTGLGNWEMCIHNLTVGLAPWQLWILNITVTESQSICLTV